MKNLILLVIIFAAISIAEAQNGNKTVLFNDCWEEQWSGANYAECYNQGFDGIPSVGPFTICNSGSLVETNAGAIFRSTFTISGSLEGKNGNSIPFRYSEVFSERNIYRAGENGGYIITFRTGGAIGGGLGIEADVSMVTYSDGTLRTEVRNTKVICR